jgi:hypothetical protein
MSFLLAICLATFGGGSDEPPADRWEMGLTSYLWLPEFDGHIGAGPARQSGTIRLSESILGLDAVGGALIAEGTRGDWSVSLEGASVFFRDEFVTRGVEADITSQVSFITLAVGHHLGRWNLSRSGETPALAFWLLAGNRYFIADSKIDIEGGPDFRKDVDWLDPFAGASLHLDLSDRLWFRLTGDIGGFQMGSKLAWRLSGLVGWTLPGAFPDSPVELSVILGYQVLDIDFTQGSRGSPDRFVLDMQTTGPVAGARIRF